MITESEKIQADKFREAAKELETDNDEKRFYENLKKLAGSKPKEDWFFEIEVCLKPI